AAGAEWAVEEGATLYASPIMASVEGPREAPTIRKGPFDTLSGIINAEGWAHPSDIRQLYDTPLIFQGKSEGYPLDMKLMHWDGTIINEEHLGMYPAGYEITESFPETVEHNGQILEIYYSDLRSKLRGTPEWIQNVDNGDTAVVTRN